MGYIRSIGNVTANLDGFAYEENYTRAEESPVRTADKEAEDKMITLIEECKKEGNTLGGVFEVVALGLPPGWAPIHSGTGSWTDAWRKL